MLNFFTEPIRISEEISFTLLSILLGLTLFVLLLGFIRWLKSVIENRLLVRINLSRGARAAISNLIGYTIILVGVLMILPIAIPGFNLTTLTLILGGVSVGIGFGLRNIADNFICGLIILIEGPIKVGDRIEIRNLQGTVVEIRARSTTVRTNDNIDIIVPNSRFVDGEVTNLSHNDRKVRFKIPVGVHYDSDLHLVKRALLEAAANCENVLKSPEPGVRFLRFDDSALHLELRVWSDSMAERPNALISEVNFAIWEKFREAGIQIPYPQRDIHVKEWPVVESAAKVSASSPSE